MDHGRDHAARGDVSSPLEELSRGLNDTLARAIVAVLFLLVAVAAAILDFLD